MNLSLRERVLEQLAEHHVLTLATAGPEGPWAAAVFYAHDGLTLIFFPPRTAATAFNIADRAEVAATIQRDYDDWPGIHGLQLCAPNPSRRTTWPSRGDTAALPGGRLPQELPPPSFGHWIEYAGMPCIRVRSGWSTTGWGSGIASNLICGIRSNDALPA
ncbi:MAG: pyridoxamine 5'-phosphate oxidase family protein [Ahniella sp.]|nr:pyridoxamine 5'-phosphate oxidase family protein [Ahniella sp.]